MGVIGRPLPPPRLLRLSTDEAREKLLNGMNETISRCAPWISATSCSRLNSQRCLAMRLSVSAVVPSRKNQMDDQREEYKEHEIEEFGFGCHKDLQLSIPWTRYQFVSVQSRCHQANSFRHLPAEFQSSMMLTIYRGEGEVGNTKSPVRFPGIAIILSDCKHPDRSFNAV